MNRFFIFTIFRSVCILILIQILLNHFRATLLNALSSLKVDVFVKSSYRNKVLKKPVLISA